MSNLISLRSNLHFLLRYNPTGEYFGKKGAKSLMPSHLFSDISSARSGLTWIRKRDRTIVTGVTYPSATLPTDWEVVPVIVEVKG